MKNLSIDKQLQSRVINRNDDIDYFIETLSYPIELTMINPYMSRLQFPQSRAILVRTSPYSDSITIHILSDSDLYSSFVNFEVNLSNIALDITMHEGFISITTQSH